MIKLRAIDRYIVYNSQTEPPSSLSGNSYKNLTLITHTDTWLETPYWAHTWSWEGPMHWDSCPCTGRRSWYSSCSWHWGTFATTPSCWEGILSPTLPTSYTLSCYSPAPFLLLFLLSVHITLFEKHSLGLLSCLQRLYFSQLVQILWSLVSSFG